MTITVKTKDLIKHCKEWENEADYIEITIAEENGKKTLEMTGTDEDGFGAIMSELEPIEGVQL